MACARRFFLLSVLLGTSMCSGCSALALQDGNWFSPDPPLTELPAVDGDRVFVELYPDKGRPMKTVIALKPGMLVSHVLRGSGTTKRFRRMSIRLVRQRPNSEEIKLDVPYLHAKKRVDPKFDYGLYPDDRLVVKENVSTPLDDLLETVGGQLTSRFRR